jgi:hypothetical protein
MAEPSTPPARAMSENAPEASAVALTAGPVEGETNALFASLTDQMKETRATSNSSPLAARANARAVKSCLAPMSSVTAPGATSMRVSDGEPKGVPSARSPGE